MKKLFFCLSAVVLLATNAHAQGVSQAQYCNGAAFYDTFAIGSTKLVSAPTIGGIYICGVAMSTVATTSISAKLTYSTSGIVNTNNTGGVPLVTGAQQVQITPAWSFNSPTIGFMVDHVASFNGLFVPSGNELNITTSGTTQSLQAIVYFWTQNP